MTTLSGPKGVRLAMDYRMALNGMKSVSGNKNQQYVFRITFLGCSIFYQFSNDVKSKMAKFLQLIGIIKRTIFRKVRMETILKIYNTF